MTMTITVTVTDRSGQATTIDAPDTGQSLMEVARGQGVPGIIGDCGGGCACATCHVYVASEWFDKVGAPDDVEADMLDMAEGVRETSRLCCQIKLTPELDGLAVTVAEGG